MEKRTCRGSHQTGLNGFPHGNLPVDGGKATTALPASTGGNYYSNKQGEERADPNTISAEERGLKFVYFQPCSLALLLFIEAEEIPGKRLNEVIYHIFYRYHSNRSPSLVHDRKMAKTSVRHEIERICNR